MKEHNATKIGIFVVNFVWILAIMFFIITLFTDPAKAIGFVCAFILGIFGAVIIFAFTEKKEKYNVK